MAKRRRASDRVPGTRATVALQRAHVTFTAHTYDHDPSVSSYGMEAAQALGFSPSRVFKTLIVDGGDGLGVGIVPVDAQLNLKAMAEALGVKRTTLVAPDVAERITGYVVGGISPVGQRRALPTVVDASAAAFDTIAVSGGRRGLDLEVSPADLVRLTQATTAEIAVHRRS